MLKIVDGVLWSLPIRWHAHRLLSPFGRPEQRRAIAIKAVNALEGLASHGAIRPLAVAAITVRDEAIRIAAVKALARVGDRESIATFMDALRFGPRDLFAEVERALERLGASEEEMIRAYVAAFTNDDWQVSCDREAIRRIAFDRLYGILGPSERLRQILVHALTHSSVGIQIEAIAFLTKSQFPLPMDALLERLSHEVRSLREAADEALATLPEARRDRVTVHLKAFEEHGYQTAERALYELGVNDDDLRTSCVTLITRLALGNIRATTEDPIHHICQRAATMIIRLEGTAAVPSLIQLLPRYPHEATAALLQLSDKRAIEPIEETIRVLRSGCPEMLRGWSGGDQFGCGGQEVDSPNPARQQLEATIEQWNTKLASIRAL